MWPAGDSEAMRISGMSRCLATPVRKLGGFVEIRWRLEAVRPHIEAYLPG